MKRVLIIGANGKIGKILSRKLKDEADFEPVAMLRKPEQASFLTISGWSVMWRVSKVVWMRLPRS